MAHETYATRFGLRPVALGRYGMVATANPLATLAGVKMLARGGNAVDAIAAAAAAIGVVAPYMSGLAGIGVFYEGEVGEALVRDLRAGGSTMTLAGLAAYPGRLAWTDPLVTTYRGVEVFAPPPPSSALQILLTLNGMAGWGLGAMEHLGT